MAVSAIVGLTTAVGAGLAIGYGFTATMFFTAFAFGAGLSVVSKALMPKMDMGSQMRGTTVTTRDPAGPRKLVYGKARVGGNVVFIHHSGSDNKYLHLVVAFATHEIESYDEIWFNDNKIWTTAGFQDDWGTYVTIDRKFGTADQAASSSLVSSVTAWTNNHKLSGIAYIAFRLEWNQDKFPQGVPNITATIRGRKVYDPRTDTTAYSSNPALCVRDYLTDQKYGLGESANLIDSASLIAAANLCDEQVDVASGGTQDRYQCNGVIDTSNQIKSNIENLLSSMGGRISYSNGKYFVEGSSYKAPTFSFDESNTVSAISIKTKQSRRSLYNGVKGTFISEEKNYKVMDYPAQISSIYASEDGDEVFLDMPLPFVTNNLQAQRIAKVALLKSRQQVVISMTVNLSGLKVKVGDTVNISNERLGYDNKVFEITDYDMVISANGESGVNLTLIETAAAVYDWTTSDEVDFLAGGELDLYDGRTVENVTNLTKTEIGLQGPDGRVLSSVELSWTPPDDAFIEFYKIRYNKTGSTNYFYGETREPRILLSGLDISSNYDFRVQGQNLIGVTSTGASLLDQELNGDQTAPGIPTSLVATGGLGEISLTWIPPSDADYSHVEVYENDTDTFGTATKIAIASADHYARTGLGYNVTRYYWLKAVDYSGNVSGHTASVNATTSLVGSEAFTPEVNNLFSEAGAYGIEPVATLPATGDFDGQIKYDTTANKLYRWDDTAGVWTDDIFSITSASVDLDSFAAGIEPVGIVSTLPNPTGYTGAQIVFNTTDNKLYRYTGTAWVASVPATDVVGTFDADNFPNNLRPVEIVSALPTTDNFEGRVVYLTTDSKLYRYNGTSFIATVSTGDLDGAIQSVQIADDAVTNAKIAVDAIQGDVIAAGAITAPKLPDGVISEIKLANAAVTNAKIATNAIQGAVIAAGAITADKILNGAISTLKLANDAVTNAKLAVNAVQGDVIAAEAITAEKILDGAISTLKLADNAVSNAKIAVNAIQGDVIAAGAISGDKIANSAVSTVKLANAAVSNAKIAVNAIQSNVIAAGAITETKIADNAVSTNKILNDAISTAKIANDAINNAKIAVNAIQGDVIAAAAITSAKIADGAISTVKIANDAVSTAKIAANAIQGDVIAANAITTTKISDSAISTAKLQAGAITTAKLAAGAVTADKILANTITASQLAAGTITAAQIAAGTITASQIAAGTITAAKIASNTITAAQLAAGSVTASEIAANAVTADKVTAGAITTNKLAVVGRGSALNSDPNTQDSTAWVKFSGATATFETITDGDVGNNVIRSGGAPWSWYNGAERLALDPSKTYRMTALARKSSNADGRLFVGVAAFDSNGSNITGDGTQWSYGAASGVTGSTTFTRYSMEFGAGTNRPLPANGVTFAPLVILNYQSTTGYFEAQDIRIEEKIPAELVVDGAITTDKLAANAVNASKIAANTITAAQIAANTLTAAQIAANAITASEIAAGAVTTDKILANAITAAKIATGTITANEIAGATITGAKIAAGTITAGNIAANTLTAAQIAANAITASEIAANAVTSAKIQAGAVSADKIAANTITAAQIAAATITAAQIASATITGAKIAAGTITASNIAANAITATQIAAGAVAASEIAAGAVTTDKLAAAAVTAAKIAANTITAGQIAAGAISTSELSANSVTASKIAVAATGQNMVLDPYPSDQQYWINAAVSFVTDSVAEVEAMGFPSAIEFDLTTTTQYPNIAKTIKVTAGKTYRATMLARATSNANRFIFMQFNFLDKDGTVVQFGSGGNTFATDLQDPNGTLCVNDQVAPSNAVSATIGYYLLNTTNQTTLYGAGQGKIWITDIFCGEKIGGELVVDGAITTDKLAANSIDASKIQAGAVSTSQLAANSITAAKIAANTITASQIASGTITATQIASNTITASQLAANSVTASEIAANAVTTAKIAAGAITADKIAANSITAGQLAAGSVSTSELAAGAITADKIASNSITAAQLAANSVSTSELAAGAVTADKIAANSITAGQIAAGAVSTSELAASSITSDKIQTGAITADKIAANSITAGQLAASSVSTSELAAGAITSDKLAVGALQADSITGDVSEHFPFALGYGYNGFSMATLSSAGATFDVDIPAPSGGVAKRPYIKGVATASTNNVPSPVGLQIDIRLKAGKSYSHTFTGFKRKETAPYGGSSEVYSVYSGNQTQQLALGGDWKIQGSTSTVLVYGFFYDQTANETFILFDDDQGDLGNGTWELTPSSSLTASSNLCLPNFGAPANGQQYTIPFYIMLPETTVATTFMIEYSGSGFLRGLNGEAGYLR